jgi:hypothetical protein
VDVASLAVGARAVGSSLACGQSLVRHGFTFLAPWHPQPISVQGPLFATWRCPHLPDGHGRVSPFFHATGVAVVFVFIGEDLL